MRAGMQTDSRKRRLRTAPPQPTDDRISITADDLAVFGAINRHGPLPSTLLYAFSQGRNFNAFQHRLTKLYNGARQAAPLLSRPPQQFQSYAARYQPLVYDLTRLSQQLLAERGAAIVARSDPFVHRLMAACFGASMELACRDTGLLYIDRTAILAKKSSTLPIPVPGKHLVPDDLFGLRYTDGSYRFFAVEIDRDTESLTGPAQSTFARKLAAYAHICGGELYRQHWGTPNLVVLTMTTSETRADSLQKLAAQQLGERLSQRFLFATETSFGVNWTIPALSNRYLTGAWRRAGGTFHIDRP